MRSSTKRRKSFCRNLARTDFGKLGDLDIKSLRRTGVRGRGILSEKYSIEVRIDVCERVKTTGEMQDFERGYFQGGASPGRKEEEGHSELKEQQAERLSVVKGSKRQAETGQTRKGKKRRGNINFGRLYLEGKS